MKRPIKDVDVDENGEPVLSTEPRVSSITGKRRKGNPQAISLRDINKVCNRIKKGNYVKQSVIACGLNYSTFKEYMRKGKKDIRPYDEYYRRVEQAKAEAELMMSERINESAENGNVGADMWKLQRMFPNRWGNAQRQEIKVDNTQQIRIVRYSDKHKEDKDK